MLAENQDDDNVSVFGSSIGLQKQRKAKKIIEAFAIADLKDWRRTFIEEKNTPGLFENGKKNIYIYYR